MLQTTLCYLERGERYLLLHRVKKAHDVNRDKWVGVGGKFLEGESPEECVVRETREETGFLLTEYRYRGIVTFVSDRWPGEHMHLFTATGWEVPGEPPPETGRVSGQEPVPGGQTERAAGPLPATSAGGDAPVECDEGVLQWIDKREFRLLPMWEGDAIFLRLLEEDAPFFSLKLQYEGERLVYAALNGAPLPLRGTGAADG